MICWDEVQQGEAPALEDLPNKINLGDVNQVLVGKECPFTQSKKTEQKDIAKAAFSLMMDDQTTHDFVASSHKQYCAWVDGVLALKGQAPRCDATLQEIDKLLDVLLQMRLVELEGLAVPDVAPVIPPLLPDAAAKGH